MSQILRNTYFILTILILSYNSRISIDEKGIFFVGMYGLYEMSGRDARPDAMADTPFSKVTMLVQGEDK